MCEQAYTVGGRGRVGFTMRGGRSVAYHSQTVVPTGVTGVYAGPCCFQRDRDGRFHPSEQHQRDLQGPTFRDATACRHRTGGQIFPGGEPLKGTAWQSTSQVQRQQILGVLGLDRKYLGGWATARDAEGKHSSHILVY
jgi:hypothetical protein